MAGITGITSYKNKTVMQCEGVFQPFKDLLEQIRPERVIEIGTSSGGLTVYIRDILDEIGLQTTTVLTHDIQDLKEVYDELRSFNIQVRVGNVLENDLAILRELESIIQGPGTSLVLCDGGYKIIEFNLLSRFLKPGDFIMAHDYIDTYENFLINYQDKIWDWCEIQDKDIEKACVENNLVSFMKETFDKIVWVCKKKI